MAQNLVLNILAKDKTKQAFNGVRAGLSNLRSAVFSVQGAIIGIGGGLAIKSILNVGSTVEQLRLRFAFLFKGVKEGDKAFQGLIDFAGRVPFSLEEIQAGAGNLAVVTKNAEELNEVLKLTGNVASVTGLDFRTTAEQIQRSFSSGIGSADLFRERGVRALLGFKAGVQVTTEETKKRFRELFGEGGEFEKATEVLSTSFTGTLSMLSDKLFKFRLDTAQAGFFDFIKQGLAEINKLIENNSEVLTGFGQKLSAGLITATKQIILGSAVIIQAIRPIFSFVGQSLLGLFDFLRTLPEGVRTFGILGFLMLGGKGKALVIIIGGFIDEIRSMMGSLLMDFAGFNQKILEIRKSLGLVSDENFVKILNQNNQLVGIATNLKKPINDYRKELESTSGGLDTTTKKLREFLNTLEAKALISAKQVEEILNKLKGATEESKNVGLELGKVKDNILTAFKKDFESINETVAKIAQSGIKAFSRGLAEALVLGKDLNMTFKEIAQKLLVDIVAFTIQIVIQETIRSALKKDQVNHEKEITNELRSQTTEMKRQAILSLFTGGSGGGMPGMANGGAVMKGKPVVVGERGAEVFVPNSSGQITQSARGTGGGAVNVNFTINTIDSRGFSEALQENRGTITGIINNALAEKGRSELV
jgi:intergrase/recombinase